jgi:D-alanine--poly(phosphoribitol) ligase, subunit 2
LKERILDILAELCADDIVKEDLDIDLREEGLIDSLDYIELLAQIEEEFGLVLSPSELTREEMSTPRKILKTITDRYGEI